MKNEPESRLQPLGLRQVCVLLGCSRRHFYRLAEAGDRGVRYLLSCNERGPAPRSHRKWSRADVDEAKRLRQPGAHLRLTPAVRANRSFSPTQVQPTAGAL